MGKIILFILIGIAVYFFFIKSREISDNKENENEFIQCDNCNTFVLKKEMQEKNGKLLCKDCYANS